MTTNTLKLQVLSHYDVPSGKTIAYTKATYFVVTLRRSNSLKKVVIEGHSISDALTAYHSLDLFKNDYKYLELLTHAASPDRHLVLKEAGLRSSLKPSLRKRGADFRHTRKNVSNIPLELEDAIKELSDFYSMTYCKFILLCASYVVDLPQEDQAKLLKDADKSLTKYKFLSGASKTPKVIKNDITVNEDDLL